MPNCLAEFDLQMPLRVRRATSSLAQYTLLVMAPPKDQEKAYWNEIEVSTLINYLYHHREEAGKRGNFESKIYLAAAEHVAFHHSEGPKKTGEMCLNNWC